jgi:putative zinc finger/helix-turn-helix YgiT family protein
MRFKTMNTLICPECKKESLNERTGNYETTYLDREGRPVPLIVPGLAWLECGSCGEVLLDDRAMSHIEAVRRHAQGLLSPAAIRAFRVGLRKTQKAMSELLGIGEKTYCRWESGSYVQSEAFDRYIRLLMADLSNVDRLQTMAQGKSQASELDQPDELARTFDAIRDIRAATKRSETFVSLLVRGELQLA